MVHRLSCISCGTGGWWHSLVSTILSAVAAPNQNGRRSGRGVMRYECNGMLCDEHNHATCVQSMSLASSLVIACCTDTANVSYVAHFSPPCIMFDFYDFVNGKKYKMIRETNKKRGANWIYLLNSGAIILMFIALGRSCRFLFYWMLYIDPFVKLALCICFSGTGWYV